MLCQAGYICMLIIQPCSFLNMLAKVYGYSLLVIHIYAGSHAWYSCNCMDKGLNLHVPVHPKV